MLGQWRRWAAVHLDKVLLLLVVACWATLYAWRPLQLGFYHDDWSLLVAPCRLPDLPSYSAMLHEHPDRPLYATFRWLFLQVWNGGTVSFQATALVVVTLAALQLYHLGRVFSSHYFASRLMPFVMPAAFLCASWTHGFTIFGSAVVGATCLLFFIASCIFNIRYVEEGGALHLVAYTAALSCSLLTYQSFMLSNLVVCLLVAICSCAKGGARAKVARNGAILAVTLLVTMAVALVTRGHSPKTIGLDLHLLFYNFSKISEILLITGQYEIFAPIGTLLQILAVLLLAGYLKSGERGRWHLLFLAFGVSCLGALVSTLPYSLAGYGLTPLGVFSRTTLTLTFWVSLGAGMLAIMMENLPTAPLKGVACVIGGAVLVLHGMVNYDRTRSWIESWKMQQKVIAGLPAAALKGLPCERTVVLVDSPLAVKGVEVFAAPWDIGGAVQAQYPDVSSCCKPGNSRVFATYKSTHWDGSTFTLVPNWTVAADHVYSVSYRTGKLTEVVAPY